MIDINESNIVIDFWVRFEFRKYLVMKLENMYLPNNFLILANKGLKISILCKITNLAAFFGSVKDSTKKY